MKTKYLVRLDDACTTMNTTKWSRVETILDEFNIKPLVGIVPANEDPKLIVESEDKSFWTKALKWQEKGWAIALHGFNHLYHQCDGGLNPLWNRTEFVSLPYETQLNKILEGKRILEEKGLRINYFFAPSHTFDLNTIKALSTAGIHKISDTIAFEPYTQYGVTLIPQIGGRCRTMYHPGTYTFCFHPNNMKEAEFHDLRIFLERHADNFTSFDSISESVHKTLSMKDRLLRSLYFIRRKLCNRK